MSGSSEEDVSVCTCHCFFFSSRRRHTRLQGDWSSDVCSSDLLGLGFEGGPDDRPRQRAAAARYLSALKPWATEQHYLPMLDDRTDTRKVFPPDRKSVV